jgi:predicted transglutaminase-like cysteine proteinase
MLRALLVCLLLAISPASAGAAPAPAAQTRAISSSTKFLHDPVELIDAIDRVNLLVNTNLIYMGDKEQYGVEEKWVMMPQSGRGDCEDFALTKYELLRQINFPALAYARIVGVIVMINGKPFGHAILAVRLPSNEVAFLDNRFDELMTRPELEKEGYRFFDWRL